MPAFRVLVEIEAYICCNCPVLDGCRAIVSPPLRLATRSLYSGVALDQGYQKMPKYVPASRIVAEIQARICGCLRWMRGGCGEIAEKLAQPLAQNYHRWIALDQGYKNNPKYVPASRVAAEIWPRIHTNSMRLRLGLGLC